MAASDAGAASAALALARRGWAVFPLRPRTKEPYGGTHGVLDATADEETIRRWWDEHPDANIGVATGAPGPDVLDIDHPDRAPTGLEGRCVARGAPTVATARGRQYYFEGTTDGTIGLGFGELRRRGSYVVAPPSIHPTGKTYTWLAEPNGPLPAVPDGVARLGKGAGKGQSEPREHIEPGAMYDYLLDKATRLARAGERDVDVIEKALVAAFELKRAPGARYGGDARDTRRIAEWAASSEIAGRECRIAQSRFARYTQPPPPSQNRAASPTTARGRLVYGHEVKLVKPKWLVPGRIPKGGITLVSGDPGQGKSSYTCLIAAGVNRGAWGDPPAGVVFASAEDSFAGRILQRAVAAGAERHLVAAFDIHDEHGGRNMELPDDVAELAAMVTEMGAALVVVDPLNAHLSTALDSFKDHGIRKALAPLARMADDLEVACVVVCHLNKDKGGSPLYRTSGSIGYVGAARSVLGFGPDPEDEEDGPLRLLEHVKSNWSDLAPTEQYRMEAASIVVDGDIHATNRLVYVGEVERDAGAAFGKRVPEDRRADAEEAIAEQLRDLLPHPSRGVKTAVMDELSCSDRTVKRAAQRMVDRDEIVVAQSGFPRTTTWQLAVGPRPVPPGGPTGENGSTKPNPAPDASSGATAEGGPTGGPTGNGGGLEELRRRYTEGWGR
jgi:hypothetical protein